MKKATNPLALDLRAGGFEVFPIAKLFDLPSNVWYPSILIRENLLAEPFAAWAANVFYTLGGVQLLQWTDAAFFYAPTGNWLRPDHVVQRLTPAKVQAIISRVIRNAESANADLKTEARRKRSIHTWPLPPCMESGDGSRQLVCAGPNASALLGNSSTTSLPQKPRPLRPWLLGI